MMHDWLTREAIGGLSIGGAALLAAILFLQSLDPPVPLKPWRWGDPPRRAKAGVELLGHLAGVAVLVTLVAIALSLSSD